MHSTSRSASAWALLTLALLILVQDERTAHGAVTYREPWRPQYHFTPATNWMNDPNGMVFYEGEYHLFYQYNPFGDKWGHMSWGHAVSRDLTQWEHLPVALYEEDGVMIFSGSAVVDWQNTSGFGRDGRPPLVAIYTGHYTAKPLQNQQIAFSNDRGRTWTKYAGNPVLDIGEKDFRDPKVFWHAPTRRWVMVVSWPTHRKVRFYASPNLKDWTHLSDFGPAGSVRGIWECPDLFPLRVEGRPGGEKWVLIVNIGSGAPAGGSGCQYFIGEFDGRDFTPDSSAPTLAPPAGKDSEAALWADWGRDFYAAVSWSDIPKRDGRRLWLGWMSNWEYANDVPTSPWRSAMSVARELRLRSTPDGLRLVQYPVRELERLRGKRERLGQTSIAKANAWLSQRQTDNPLLELRTEVETGSRPEPFELLLHTGPKEVTALRYDPAQSQLALDRSRSGRVDFHPKFKDPQVAPLAPTGGRIALHILLDTSSVEVFANHGEIVLTSLILPEAGPRRFEFRSPSPTLRLHHLELHELNSTAPSP